MRAEENDRQVQLDMAQALDDAKANLSGRDRFERIEKTYEEHNYHPIKSVISMAPIMLQLPFLLGALFLLIDNAQISDAPFLFISDLGQPDRLIQTEALSINVMPVLITVVALFEAFIKPKMTRVLQLRFLFVALVIALLNYLLPVGVCLYWLTSNITSLARTALEVRNGST